MLPLNVSMVLRMSSDANDSVSAAQAKGATSVIAAWAWRLIARSLRAPYRHTPTALLGGWLPRGVISTGPLKDTVRRVVPDGWADHPNLWIVACDYATGRRVAFGREDAPAVDLADAVAASCAIPGFYHPVKYAVAPPQLTMARVWLVEMPARPRRSPRRRPARSMSHAAESLTPPPGAG